MTPNRLHGPGIALAALVLLLAVASAAVAQPFDYGSIEIKVTVEPASIGQGGEGVIVVTLTVPFGYTLTDSAATFRFEPGETAGVAFGELVKPEHDHEDEAGGHWGGMPSFRLPFSVAADAELGAREVPIALRLQACDDMTGVCFRPTPMETSAAFEVVAAGAGGERPSISAASPEEASVEAEPGGGALDESLKNWLEDAIAGGQIWLAILIALAAGILTSLTPCVYPMIPVTISYVSGRAEGKKINGFLISLVLVLGIVITYTALGVVAALAGSTFGSIGQNLWVQGFLLVVLVAMGLSMLGAFEIGLPASMQQKMQSQRKGYFGALFVGLTIGFVAAPCVAPVLIPILTLIATSGNLLLGVIMMATYAIGMGLLFILIGTFSNLVLPRSGQWMIELKKVFGFVLFLVAVFFARGLIEAIPIPHIYDFVLGSLLVLFGTVVGAFHRIESDAGWWRLIGKAAGLLLVTAGLVLFALAMIGPALPGLAVGTAGETPHKPEPPWIKDLDAGLERAAADGKPAVVDFWAEWCAACHELDNLTWSDPRVLAEMARFVPIKIDGTDESDPVYQQARQRYGVQALPRVVIINGSGEVERVFDGFRDADTVLAYLEAVK